MYRFINKIHILWEIIDIYVDMNIEIQIILSWLFYSIQLMRVFMEPLHQREIRIANLWFQRSLHPYDIYWLTFQRHNHM